MANKIRNVMTRHLKWYSEGKATLKELHSNCDKLGDLVFQMWMEDLISDKVKEECFAVISDYLRELIRISMNESKGA